MGPANSQFLGDTVFVASMTKAGGSVTVTSGSNAPVTTTVPAGVFMMAIPMGTGTQRFSMTTAAGTGSGTGNVTISADCWVSFGLDRADHRTGSIISIIILVQLQSRFRNGVESPGLV